MMEDRKYEFKEGNGMGCDKELNTDFQICVVEKQITIYKKKDAREVRYLLKVTREDGSTVCKWSDDLKKIKYFEMFEVDDTFLTPRTRKLLLSKLIREASELAPKMILSDESGLREIEGRWVYKLKGEVIYGEEKNRIWIPVHDNSDKNMHGKLSDVARAYINLLPGVTEVLFFFALFTIVKPFVELLDLSCGFALALIGLPGQLKTSLIRKYCLWVDWRSENEILFTEKIHEKDIIGKLDSQAGLCFLIDDLRKMADSNENRKQMSRLDHIVRHVNAAHSDCANVAITGETLSDMGIFSCLDRIFQVKMRNLTAGEVKDLKRKLSELPANFMWEIAVEFTKSLMANVNKVKERIKDFYENNVFQPNATGEYATRTNRHAMFIRMAEALFSELCMELNTGEQLRLALEEQSRIYEAELIRIRASEQPRDYVVDIFETFINQRVLPMYTGRRDYFAAQEDYAYLLENKKLFITKMTLEKGLKKHCGRYIGATVVVQRLKEEGILIDPSETGNVKGKQVRLAEKSRHYVIDMEMLIDRLLERGYAVDEETRRSFCG